MSIYQQLATGLVKQKEEAIRKAINHAMGHKDWELHDVANRCRFVYIEGHMTETLYFDNIALITFFPVRTEINRTDTSTSLVAVQNYKILYQEN